MAYQYDRVPHEEIERQVFELMAASEITPRDNLHLIYDTDKPQRFDVEGDRKGEGSGWYIIYSDGCPAGWIGDWHGIAVKFVFDFSRLEPGYEKIREQSKTPEFKAEARRLQAERDKRRKQTQTKAADEARVYFESAGDAPTNHPYWERKKVFAPGLKIDGGRNLLLPFRDARGRVQCVQRIPAEAGAVKKHWPGCSPTGAWFTLGQDIVEGPVLVSEGIATGATIFQCTEARYMVVVVGDCHNLLPVCKELRKKYPGRRIVIMRDDDVGPDKNGNPKRNVGAEAAAKCLKEKVADWVCSPRFERVGIDRVQEGGKPPSDWNDYYLNHGEDKAAQELSKAIEWACMSKEERQKAEDRAKIRAQVRQVNAADLMKKEFAPVKWAVEPILPEGCSLLCGAPKVGKSYLALHLALAVATGEQAFQQTDVEKGSVFYLALEDPERRVQSRIREAALSPNVSLEKLDFATAIPRQNQGGIEYLREWLEAHPDARLVIVDTLQKFRPPRKAKGDLYGDDYDCIGAIKSLADEFRVPILIVHHLKKGRDPEGDWLNEVSGTAGIAGAADTIMVLKRGRLAQTAILSLTGRDVEEAEYALSRDDHGWKMEGTAEEFNISQDKKQIINFLKEHGKAKPKEIAEALGKKAVTVRVTLTRMLSEGKIHQSEKGVYCL